VLFTGFFLKKGQVKEIMDNGLYEGLFHHHPDGVFSLGSFDSIQEANERFAQRLGYVSGELVQLAFSSLVALEDINRYFSFLKKALNGEAQNLQISLLHKNGQQVLTHLTFIPIQNKESMKGVCGFTRDVEINRLEPSTVIDTYGHKNNIDHAQQVGHFGIWEFNVLDNEYKCSPNMCTIFGWEYTYEFKTTSEFILSCIHMEDRNKVHSNYNQSIIEGIPYEQEYRIYTNNGERYILSQGNPVKDEQGKVDRLIGTVHDITDQKQTEIEKIEWGQWYKSLFTHISDPTFMYDIHGKRLDVNQATLDMLGLSKQEMLNQDFTSTIHFRDLQRAQENFKDVLSGLTKTFELALLHKDGHLIIVNTVWAPIIVQDGVVGVIGVSKDITEQKQAKRRLEESEQRYRSLFLHNPDGVFSFDLNGNFIHCNFALEQLLGYTSIELMEGSFVHLVHPNDLEKTNFHFQKAIEGESQNYNIVCLHKEGHLVDVNVTNLPITVDGEIVGVYGIAKDITKKKKAFKSLKDAEKKYRTLVEESVAAVFIIRDDHMVYTNPKAHELLGITDSLIGRSAWDFIHPDDMSKARSFKEKLETETSSMTGSCRLVRGDGKVIDVEFHISLITYEGRSAHIYTILDVTEQKKVYDLHSFLAHHDPLTNLPNRRLFEQEVDQALIMARTCNQKLAVMYVDLDRFKYINDTLGHEIGDQLLQDVSDRLKKCVRAEDVVGRMGGDEFTILLPIVMNVDQAVEIAESIRTSLEKPFDIGEYELFITSSVGISLYPVDGDDVKTLLKNADTALYRAKEYGKNNHQVYSSSMNIQTFKSYSLEKDLRRAIHHGELELYYQPKVDAISGQIKGGEALVRWNHPDWGMISPDEFIPLAEESGLMIPLGGFVKETVCRQNKAWQQMGLPPIPISINMSPQRFLQKDMIKRLESFLSSMGLDPQWLEIEITENSVLKNEDLVIHTLNYLNELGVKIAIDDFGTGYSSLAYLKRFRFDTLKIDKSFIQGITEDVKDAKITSAATHLAKSFGVTVVAEGVESIEQLHFLQKIKCDQIQGYIFSKPVPVDDFTKLLRKGKLTISLNNGVPDNTLENQ
jgi:diguanylate cyclase (GGDEF)-like protein/PAS domain S-box-containing protein